MEKKDQHPHVYKPIMAGLFAGIVATIVNMVFDVIFRESTGFSLSEIINVATIIFGTLLVLVFAGVIFALLDRYLKYPTALYITSFLILSFLGVRFALHVYRTENPLQNNQFHFLFTGIVIISGLMATFLVPYLSKNESAII